MASHLQRLGQICLKPHSIWALAVYSGLCLATLASALGYLGTGEPMIMASFAALSGIGMLFSLALPAAEKAVPTVYLWLTLVPFSAIPLLAMSHTPTQQRAFGRLR